MTRDDIYEHLAQVYLGKKVKAQKEKKQKFNAWLVINIVITLVIFASASYGLSAYLTRRGEVLHNKVIYALNNGPIRINYNLKQPFPSVKTFSMSIPEIDVSKYKELQFSIRGMEEGSPGIMRIELKNSRNEIDSIFVEGINLDWKNFQVPFEDFQQISDWTHIETVSFVLEAWNARKVKGAVLIDDVCFSG